MSRSIYGDVHSRTALRAAFREIRRDIGTARSPSALQELYRRAGYVVSLTYEPSWRDRFGDELDEIRRLATEEFARSARAINRRSDALGSDARYELRWDAEPHVHPAPRAERGAS
ncbi:MAG: hypothetical protein AB7G21_09155 [Dehalococcoidia bacterium]